MERGVGAGGGPLLGREEEAKKRDERGWRCRREVGEMEFYRGLLCEERPFCSLSLVAAGTGYDARAVWRRVREGV